MNFDSAKTAFVQESQELLSDMVLVSIVLDHWPHETDLVARCIYGHLFPIC